MQRYQVTGKPPPQYLGGVGPYDVFYWAHGPYDGKERLIVKWHDKTGCFYHWNFDFEQWENSAQQRVDTMSREDTETILAMYECFAVKPTGTEQPTEIKARQTS